jgi:hypothetical protein
MDTRPIRPYDGRSLTKRSDGIEPLIQAIDSFRKIVSEK